MTAPDYDRPPAPCPWCSWPHTYPLEAIDNQRPPIWCWQCSSCGTKFLWLRSEGRDEYLMQLGGSRDRP